MTITYEELKEVTNNFDGNDFWYWFLTYDQILDWFMSEFYPIEGVVEYMQDMGVVKS